MPEQTGVVRRIAWREICPWLIIFRSFRISISLPVLVLATAGWLLTPLGPTLGNLLFLRNEPLASVTWLPALDGVSTIGSTRDLSTVNVTIPVSHVYSYFVMPAWQFATGSGGVKTTAYHAFCFFWNIAVWSFVGVAICRIAAVQLGRGERVDLPSALRYAGSHYAWSFTAPLFPIFGVILVGAPIALLGLVMRLDLGVLLAGIVWPLALVGGLIMTALLLGLAAGWPLMWPTIGSEEHGDAFEAFSRSFSYVFQRPLHLFLYAILAVAFGTLGWLVVSAFTEAVLGLTASAASWGAGAERIIDLGGKDVSGTYGAGATLILAFNTVVRLVALAFHFSFFFCVSTAIYLVLRRDVDQTDFDEVFVEDESERYSLPALKATADGVPGVGASDETPVEEVSDGDDRSAT